MDRRPSNFRRDDRTRQQKAKENQIKNSRTRTDRQQHDPNPQRQNERKNTRISSKRIHFEDHYENRKNLIRDGITHKQQIKDRKINRYQSPQSRESSHQIGKSSQQKLKQQALYQSGLKFYQQKEYLQALRIYRSCFQSLPSSFETVTQQHQIKIVNLKEKILLEMILCFKLEKSNNNAIKYCDHLIQKFNNKSKRVLAIKTICLIREKRYSQALTEIRQIQKSIKTKININSLYLAIEKKQSKKQRPTKRRSQNYNKLTSNAQIKNNTNQPEKHSVITVSQPGKNINDRINQNQFQNNPILVQKYTLKTHSNNSIGQNKIPSNDFIIQKSEFHSKINTEKPIINNNASKFVSYTQVPINNPVMVKNTSDLLKANPNPMPKTIVQSKYSNHSNPNPMPKNIVQSKYSNHSNPNPMLKNIVQSKYSNQKANYPSFLVKQNLIFIDKEDFSVNQIISIVLEEKMTKTWDLITIKAAKEAFSNSLKLAEQICSIFGFELDKSFSLTASNRYVELNLKKPSKNPAPVTKAQLPKQKQSKLKRFLPQWNKKEQKKKDSTSSCLIY